MPYGYKEADIQFLDADHPQYPMALPPGVPFVVERTEVNDEGYTSNNDRACTIKFYVRRKQ